MLHWLVTQNTRRTLIKNFKAKVCVCHMYSMLVLHKCSPIWHGKIWQWSHNKLNTKLSSFERKCYIPRTCTSPSKQLKAPCQTVFNGLFFENIPRELGCVNNLEVVLFLKDSFLKKIVVMFKGKHQNFMDQ